MTSEQMKEEHDGITLYHDLILKIDNIWFNDMDLLSYSSRFLPISYDICKSKGLNKKYRDKVHTRYDPVTGVQRRPLTIKIDTDILDKVSLKLKGKDIITNEILNYIKDNAAVNIMLNTEGDTLFAYLDKRYSLICERNNKSYELAIVIQVSKAALKEYKQGNITLDTKSTIDSIEESIKRTVTKNKNK
jgi:hypothetical protein